MNLVTKSAIDFTAPAVMPDGKIDDGFNLKEYINGKFAILFFYPLNFTFVCPTEIIAFSNKVTDCASIDTEIIGINTDSKYSHLHWRGMEVEKGGIGKINFPLVSDIKKSITRSYDVLYDDSIALRATFIIDKNFIVRHQSINDLPLGRNVDEYIRIIDAINHNENYGEVCPAGWRKGEPAMEATKQGIEDFLKSHIDKL